MGMRLPVIRTLTIIVCFCLVPHTKLYYLAAQVILPVSGRVVDGVTGKPIEGVSLTLQISTYAGFSVHTEVKNTAISNLSGRFSIAGAIYPATSPLDQIRSYWLTVNEGIEETGQEETSAETQVLYNPMSNRRGEAVGDKRYFPLTVTFRPEGCERVWAATCMYIASRTDIVIPIIPVLDGYGCNAIGESSLQEKCRQLNTYRGAFLHADTYEEVQNGKELCRKLPSPQISQPCLDQLALYVANPAYDRPIKPQVNQPTPPGMFPDSIAGLPAMNNGHCGPQLEFDGRVECAAGYGTTAKQLVAVYFQQWPEASNKPQEWSHVGNQTAVSGEVRTGGKVLRFQGKWFSGVEGADGKLLQYEHKIDSYVWYSGNTLVEVLFYDPIPEQDQFLSYYLGKFPSTSK